MLESSLQCILAKTGFVFIAFISVLGWTIRSSKAFVALIAGVLISLGLLFLIVRWCMSYLRLRKEFYNLDNQYRMQFESFSSKKGDAGLIVFRRH